MIQFVVTIAGLAGGPSGIATVEQMQRDGELKAAVEREWIKALEHAGLDSHRGRLWFGLGQSPKGAGANYFLPIRLIDGDHGLDDKQLAEAHSDVCAGLHRVVVYPDYVPSEGQDLANEDVVPTFGAMLRHELQHALQFEACGPEVFDLEDLVQHIIEVKAVGLPGSMALYNAKPMEIDANDAAASYLRDVHPNRVKSILEGPLAQLARSNTGPEKPSTLLARTICFLYIHRDTCRLASEGFPFVERIRVCSEAGAALWQKLDAAGGPNEGQ